MTESTELDHFFNLALDLLCIADTDGHFHRLNPQFEKVLGYSHDELMSHPFLDFVHPDDVPSTLEAIETLVAQQDVTNFVNRYRCKDGTYRWIEWRSTPVGKVIYAAARDITERMQAEEALRQSRRELIYRNQIAGAFLTVSDEEMYDAVLNILLEASESEHGVFGYIDENGAYVAPSMTRHVWNECQISDKAFVFPRETWGDSIWPRAIREVRTLYSNEPSTLTPNGHIVIERNITVPVIYFGRVIGLFQVANKATDYDDEDIRLMETLAGAIAPVLSARLQRDKKEQERKLAEEALRSESERSLQFSYALAHDLQTPLRTVSNYLTFLREALVGCANRSEWAQHLEAITVATHQMKELLDALIQYVKLGNDQVKQAVDCNGVVASVLEQVVPADVEVDILTELPNISGVRVQVYQLFRNLLSNAVKYAASGRPLRIDISVQEADETGYWLFSVADNGIGIAPDKLDEIFEPFVRLHSYEEVKGTGLGLAICHQIIEGHGGRIWVESEPGQGSVFRFTLPGVKK